VIFAMSQTCLKNFSTFFAKKVTFHVTFSTISRKSTYQLNYNKYQVDYLILHRSKLRIHSFKIKKGKW